MYIYNNLQKLSIIMEIFNAGVRNGSVPAPVAALANHFLQQHASAAHSSPPSVSAEQQQLASAMATAAQFATFLQNINSVGTFTHNNADKRIFAFR